MIPAIIGAVLESGTFEAFVSPLIIAGLVGICGIVGGLVNLWGRGPVIYGAIIGLFIGLGGYGAVYGWLQFRGDTRIFRGELALAFVIGAVPGFGLQKLFQMLHRKSTQAAAA
jgi:hypothetical protein